MAKLEPQLSDTDVQEAWAEILENYNEGKPTEAWESLGERYRSLGVRLSDPDG